MLKGNGALADSELDDLPSGESHGGSSFELHSQLGINARQVDELELALEIAGRRAKLLPLVFAALLGLIVSVASYWWSLVHPIFRDPSEITSASITFLPAVLVLLIYFAATVYFQFVNTSNDLAYARNLVEAQRLTIAKLQISLFDQLSHLKNASKDESPVQVTSWAEKS